MGGTSQTNQASSQNQSSQTAPWQPTQGALNGILSGINGINAAPTAAQTGALNTIQQNAQGAQNYGGQATGLANDLMTGGPDRTGFITSALSGLQGAQNYDPTQAPGMQSLLETIRGDVGNSVNGMFAGAGRDMSGMNQQALARGISQGEASPLLAQYNQNYQNQFGNVGAATSGANALQGMDQQSFQNRATGLDTALNGIPAAQNNQANQILSAASQQYNLPISQLAGMLGLTLPIAGLGSQSSGTGNMTSHGTQTDSGMRQFMQFGQGLGGMAKAFGGGGGGG